MKKKTYKQAWDEGFAIPVWVIFRGEDMIAALPTRPVKESNKKAYKAFIVRSK